MAISMLKIRRPLGRLIFNMGIAIPGKTVFLIETAPWYLGLTALPISHGYYIQNTHSKDKIHDDNIKWKHFPSYWPFVRGTTGDRWIPLKKASDAELWYFLWSAPEQTVKQIIEMEVIWDATTLIVTSL